MEGERIFGLERGKAALLAAILFAMFLSSLDGNIVATAMPTIVRELGGLDIFSWVFSAYLITSTVAIMLGGKLGDIYGRKSVYTGGILVFLVGSALCGLSRSMATLILFRGLQGIGGGLMMISTMAIIGDIFPPAERGKWQGIFGAVFALASIIGPLVGAVITDHIGWPWIFYVNLPLGPVVLYLLARAKYTQPRSTGGKIDLAGAVCFTVFAVLLIVYLVSGVGRTSALYGVLLAISLAFLALLIWQERRAAEPIIPLRMFANRVFLIASVSSFIQIGALSGAVAFLPLLMQGALGRGATAAGRLLTPMLLGFVLASAAVGQVISRTGRYKLAGLAGSGLVVLGLFLLSDIQGATSYRHLLSAVVVLGLGLGTTAPLFLMVTQNAFDNSQIGVVTSAFGFLRNLGSAVIVAVMGAVVNVSGDMAKTLSVDVAAPALVRGIGRAFGMVFILSLLPLALVFFLQEIPLRKTHGAVGALAEVGLELAETEEALDDRRATLGNEQ